MRIFKVILTIITASLFLAISTSPSMAIDPPTMYELGQEADPEEKINLTQYVQNQVPRSGFALYCEIVGNTDANCVPNGNLLSGGVLPPLQSGITYVATKPPVRTAEYIADVLDNGDFLAKPAYAQGVGFSGLSPVLDLWKVFRNLSYFIFILVFVIIGFMIMFRQRIDPQTVVSIQTALPKLAVTLIIITFSYAIAGLIVDLMYLSIYLIIALFQTNGIISDTQVVLNNIFGLNIFSIGWRYFVGYNEVAGAAGQSVGSLISQIMGSGGWGDFAGVIFWLILAFSILIALLRTFLSLITAYVGIILSTIFAPITLLANNFPGSASFANWIKGLVANAALFPIIVVMLIIGAYLVGAPSSEEFGVTINPTNSGGFIPPLIGGNSAQQTGPEPIRAIIGLGILLLIPEILNIVKEILQVQSGLGEKAVENARRGSFIITTPGKRGISTGIGYGEAQLYTRMQEATTPSDTRRRRRILNAYRAFFGMQK